MFHQRAVARAVALLLYLFLLLTSTPTATPAAFAQEPIVPAQGAKLVVDGYTTQLIYNPTSHVLFAISQDVEFDTVTISVIQDDTIKRVHTFGSYGDRYSQVSVVVPNTAKVYVTIAQPPADDKTTDTILLLFDGANLVGNRIVPGGRYVRWNENKNKGILVLDPKECKSFSAYILNGLDVAQEIGIPYGDPSTCSGPFPQGFQLGLHSINPVNGDMYLTNWSTVFWTLRIDGTFESSSMGNGNPPRANGAGTLYFARGYRSGNSGPRTGYVDIVDGDAQTSSYQYTLRDLTTGTLASTYAYAVPDPKRDYAYVLLDPSCNYDNQCEAALLYFHGRTEISRLDLDPSLRWNLVDVDPETSDAYLIGSNPTTYASTLHVVRNNQVVKATSSPGHHGFGGGYRLGLSTGRLWLFSRPRLVLYEDGLIAGAIEDNSGRNQATSRIEDYQETENGVWVAAGCWATDDRCEAYQTRLEFHSFASLRARNLWLEVVVSGLGADVHNLGVAKLTRSAEPEYSHFDVASGGSDAFAGLTPGEYVVQMRFESEEAIYSGYVRVTLTGNQQFTRVEVPLTRTTSDNPVIFIPGVAGSTLADPSRELWPALFDWGSKDKLALDPDAPPVDVRATSPLWQVAVPVIADSDIYSTTFQFFTDKEYTPYSYGANLSMRPGYGCNNSQLGATPTFFPFPYDWRKDLAGEADRLKNYVDCIKQLHPGKTINIVAHSMGGLVARQYILKHPGDHGIGKVVTIGTPWLGAPRAINALFTGKFLDWLQHRAIIGERSLKELLEYFPGAHQLFPSERYYSELGGHPLFLTTDQGINCQHGSLFSMSQSLSFPESMTWLDCMYPGSKPSAAVTSFHTAAQDDWRTKQDTGVEYFIIYGQTAKNETIGTVSRIENETCLGSGVACIPLRFTLATPTAGDGTVPLISSTRQANGRDLNGSEARLCPAPGSAQEHGEMARSGDVLNLTLAILNGNASGCTGVSVAAVQAESAYYLTVNGTDIPDIIDSQGRSTIRNGATVSLADLPGVALHELDENAYLVIFSKDQPYTVTLPITSTAVLLTVAEGTGDQSNRTIVYRDLAVAPEQKMRLTLSPSAISPLTVDRDRNGSFETTLPSYVDATGPAASDTTPPTVQITSTKVGAGYRVVVAAQDSIGIKTIFYSTDGTKYQPYSAPVSIQPTQAKVLYAFADDLAGNRSATVTLSIEGSSRIYLPTIQR